MMTPTLFDIASITGMRCSSESFTPTAADEDVIGFDKDNVGFTMYVEVYLDQKVDPVSNENHIVFLALWLLKCVFCCRSLKVEKRFIALSH